MIYALAIISVVVVVSFILVGCETLFATDSRTQKVHITVEASSEECKVEYGSNTVLDKQEDVMKVNEPMNLSK